MLPVQTAFELGGEVAADGGPDLFVEAVVDVSVEHGGLADSWFSHHAELDDDILVHGY